MFKKRKRKSNQRVTVAGDDEDQVWGVVVDHNYFNSLSILHYRDSSIQPANKNVLSMQNKKFEEDEDDIMESLGLNKSNKVSKRQKNKLTTLGFKESEDTKKINIDIKALKKNLVNTDAIASVNNAKPIWNESAQSEQTASRYSKESIDQLKTRQYQSNKNVSDYIHKSESRATMNATSDEEFEDEEVERMQQIKDIRTKKKLAQKGLSMNTKQEEFLAPKDVVMAEEEIEDLKHGIETNEMYCINDTPNDMYIDDFGDGENWINNQIGNALGSDQIFEDSTFITPFRGGSNQNDLTDTSEMRSLKHTMMKGVDSYTSDLMRELSGIKNSIKRNSETMESIKNGLQSHEKDIEQATQIIKQEAPKFQKVMEFTELLEDIGGMLDEKEDEIDNVFDNLQFTEQQFLKSVEDVKEGSHNTQMEPPPQPGLGGRRKGLGFNSKQKSTINTDQASNSIKMLKGEFEKDIEAAKSILGDILSKVREDYTSPGVLYNHLLSMYSDYSSGFTFSFDILDMIDYLVPYLKIDMLSNYSSETSPASSTLSSMTNSAEMSRYLHHEAHSFCKFIQSCKDALKDKGAEREVHKLGQVHSQVVHRVKQVKQFIP